MAIADLWNKVFHRDRAGAGRRAAQSEEQLDARRRQYEAEQSQRGRMGPTQGAGNVGF